MKSTTKILGALVLLAGWCAFAPTAARAQAQQPDPDPPTEIRAETPADQMASKVRSIRRNEYFYQSYGRRDLCAANWLHLLINLGRHQTIVVLGEGTVPRWRASLRRQQWRELS